MSATSTTNEHPPVVSKPDVRDIELTEEQLQAIDQFVKWYQHGTKHGFGKRPTWKLAGPAGSGKSTIALYALQAAGLDPWSSDVCKVAYTGKAALVMQQKGLQGAGTIHSRIYIPVDDVSEEIRELRSRLLKLRGTLGSVSDEDRERVLAEITQLGDDIKNLQEGSDDGLQWILNPNGAPANSKLVLCDEASMVGGRTQIDLESYDTPIFYLGDSFQLQPITDEADSVSVFFNNLGRPLDVDFQLKEIHRQAEGNPIIRYSRALRENRRDEIAFMGKMVGEDGGMFIRAPRAKLSVEHFARAEQVIVGRNNTRHDINDSVRQFLKRDSPYPQAQDRLIILRNDKTQNVVNGMMGVAASDYYDFNSKANTIKVEVDLEDGRQITANTLVPYFQSPGDPDALYAVPAWSRRANLHCDYAYAITCNKAQGSQFNSGIVLSEPLGKIEEDRRRWSYTAITRFAERVVVAV